MSNVLLVSSGLGSSEPDDGTGGSNPTEQVTWLDPVFHEYLTGPINPNSYGSEYATFRALGNRKVWFRYFDFYFRTYDQVAYEITSSDGSNNESEQVAIIAPWTASFNPATAQVWNSPTGSKLVFSTAHNDAGNNPAGLISVDPNTKMFHSSISRAQMMSATGNTSATAVLRNLRVVISPDGQHIIMAIRTGSVGSGDPTRLYRVNIDVDGFFTGLTALASPISVESRMLAAASNTHIYQWEVVGGSTINQQFKIVKRNIFTGIIENEFLDPRLTFAQKNGINTGLGTSGAKIVGNHMYFTSEYSDTTYKNAKIWKYKLSTDTLVGSWNITNPPPTPGFTPILGQPGESNQNNLSIYGIDIDTDMNVYIDYSGDQALLNSNYYNTSSNKTALFKKRIFKLRLN